MRVTNQAADLGAGTGPFSELYLLQAEFHTRLTEETMRYLRRLQGTVGPAAPGTIVMPNNKGALQAEVTQGASLQLSLEVENRQKVHVMVSPYLTPLVGQAGTTWFPAAQSTGAILIAPGKVETIMLRLTAPVGLPPDKYAGAVLLLGFREDAVPVTIRVRASRTGKAAATPTSKRAATRASTRKSRRRRTGRRQGRP